jgi:hypothetical protein
MTKHYTFSTDPKDVWPEPELEDEYKDDPVKAWNDFMDDEWNDGKATDEPDPIDQADTYGDRQGYE